MKLKTFTSGKALFVLLFAAPVLAAAVYYGAVAADRYVSQSVVSVRDTSSSGNVSSAAGAVAALLGGGGGAAPSISDTVYLQNYIHSMDMMRRLDARLNLRKHFEQPWYDPFYRLWPGASQEWMLRYFRSRVEVTRDDYTGLLTIDVQGFEPEFTRQLAQAVLEEGERFINDYTHRIARERLTFAETEAKLALGRSQEVKAQIVAFQARNKLLDPMSQAQANNQLTGTLQAALAKQEADLKSALDFLAEDTYQVKALRSQLAATRTQLEAERLRVTVSNNGEQLTALAVQYQGLLAQATFHDEAYRAALIGIEAARADTLRKVRTLVVVDPPVKAESAVYPARLYDFLTVLALCGMLFSIVRLVIATIREHQD
ncbi:capsular biosynthesis protein [Ideonella margarita]|uniref:Capsular biosynthesis protein n=1 Tax=Ideonella margarita TaxID=2984191 RepID=A0ABU9C1G6_9BURK